MRLFENRVFSACLAVSLGFAACGEDTTKSAEDDASADGDSSEVEVDPWEAPTETGAFRILYNNRGRLPDNATENELWMMDSDGSDELAITDLGGLEDLDPPLSCNFGCIVSPDLKWIAVVAGPPTAKGFELKLGKFNPDMKVSLLKGGSIKDVVDFAFAGDRIFYSKQKSCTGASCEFEFTIVELSENVNLPLPFLTFPQGEELTDSTYKGHFRVSADGKNMVMLKTTIRSVGVWLWKDGTGLVELDFLCKFGTKGNCSGTGSEYTDVDPVAIDPTGRYIVFFSFADRWQRAHVYDTQNPSNIQSSIIATAPDGAYIEKACTPGLLADWQWQKVIGQPHFTPDSSEVVFIGETACPENGQQPQKSRTNLYRVKLATLQSGKTLEESDVFNITNHPFGDVTANRRPNAFAMSPDGATIVFTGTPSYDQSGALIADGAARQRNDREVYRIRLDGTNVQQLTNDLPFSAESPMVVGP
jgi:hypothetical protein